MQSAERIFSVVGFGSCFSGMRRGGVGRTRGRYLSLSENVQLCRLKDSGQSRGRAEMPSRLRCQIPPTPDSRPKVVLTQHLIQETGDYRWTGPRSGIAPVLLRPPLACWVGVGGYCALFASGARDVEQVSCSSDQQGGKMDHAIRAALHRTGRRGGERWTSADKR